MPFVFEVPNEYGYVFIVATGAFILNFVHGIPIGKLRKKVGVIYPQHYATQEQVAEKPEAFIYNCAQRAHGNYIENLTPFLASLFIAGLQFPLTAAGLGVAWLVSRYVYMIGYTNPAWGKNGSGRLRGGGYFLAQTALFGMTAWTGYKMITA